MQATSEQIEFYNWVDTGKGHALLSALAGTGKTTTLKKAINRIPKNKSIISLAFNEPIAKELRRELPAHVETGTVHSTGLKMMRSAGLQSKFSKGYTKDLIKNKISAWSERLSTYNTDQLAAHWAEEEAFLRLMQDQLTICKQYVCIEKNDIKAVLIKYGFQVESRRVQVIWNLLHRTYSFPLPYHDFADMIYLPASGRVPVKKYDWVFVDEAQDLNRAQFIFIKQMMHTNTRLVFVGDKHQAIYGFAGADSDSFKNILSLPNISVFPLTTCFRCHGNIIHFINNTKVNKDITAFQTNKDKGMVRYGSISELTEGDLVICRLNKPLMQLYYHLQEEGISAQINGKQSDNTLKDIKQILKGKNQKTCMVIFQELKTDSLSLQNTLTKSTTIPIEDNPKWIRHLSLLEEIRYVAERTQAKTGKELLAGIADLFVPKTGGVRLMTIHNSKGLEADRVFILGDDLTPNRNAKQDWELEQEANLRYVSYSRAIKEVVFINDFKFHHKEAIWNRSKRFEYYRLAFPARWVGALKAHRGERAGMR